LIIDAFDNAAQERLKQYSLVLSAAIRVTILEKENRSLRMLRSSDFSTEQIMGQNEILGDSPAIHQLLHEIDIVADSEVPILLLGETGVGKELFARRLHRQSRRHKRPMVQVNCAALPDSLAESELF